MAITAAIKNTKIMLLVKPFSVELGFSVGRRCMSKLATQNHLIKNTTTEVDLEMEGPAADERRRSEAPASCWMPDPRTGIYFPKGQEWVMDGIPNGAASFDRTFWLRSIDGVDHDHNTPDLHNLANN